MSLTPETAAHCLAQLGNPTRLEVFRLLVRAAPEGLSVGALKDRLGVPASTLTHHIQHLRLCGLVEQAREGRVLRCRADTARMDDLLAYLSSECCLGFEDETEKGAAA